MLDKDYSDFTSDFDDRLESDEEIVDEEIEESFSVREEDYFYRHLEEY